jgi:hypothetical protein
MGYCCIWADFYLAQLLGPVRPGLAAHGRTQGALSHGARAGAAVASRILGEGQRGTVGQRRLGHEGGAVDRFEGKRGQETHRTGFSTAVGIGPCGSSARSCRGGRDWSWSGQRCSSRRYSARGRVDRVVPWPEVPIRVEALLGGNSGAWIFEDAPRCGARV